MGKATEVSKKPNVKYGYPEPIVTFPHNSGVDEQPKSETFKEKIQRQQKERYQASERAWAFIQENDARYAAHRASILASRKSIELEEFSLGSVLANPELDSISSVKLDPVSMLVDDIESLITSGKEFINNPTWYGVASMAAIAIPGKILDDVGGKLAKEAFERNPLKEINGRKIINSSELAGKAVKTDGGEVFFDYDGFPDFTSYAEKIVRVEGLTGYNPKDAQLAMQTIGMSDYNQKSMVWHHHQDGLSMMLVPRNIHSISMGGVGHTGGGAVIKHNKSNPENPLNYPSPQEK